jgi:hypothetical protein
MTLASGVEITITIKNEKYLDQAKTDKIVFGKIKVHMPHPNRAR